MLLSAMKADLLQVMDDEISRVEQIRRREIDRLKNCDRQIPQLVYLLNIPWYLYAMDH